MISMQGRVENHCCKGPPLAPGILLSYRCQLGVASPLTSDITVTAPSSVSLPLSLPPSLLSLLPPPSLLVLDPSSPLLLSVSSCIHRMCREAVVGSHIALHCGSSSMGRVWLLLRQPPKDTECVPGRAASQQAPKFCSECFLLMAGEALGWGSGRVYWFGGPVTLTGPGGLRIRLAL